jgi:LacI family transcriptional regulator
MAKKVLLKDIAKEVGVSTALVSYVLNGKAKEQRVGEEMARRITKVAKKLNYQPNLIARGLKSGRTKTLGLIVADISNPFFAMLARIIENEAAGRGYTVIIGSSDEKIDKSKKLIDTFLNRQVDGLIITPVEGSSTQLKLLNKMDMPYVLIDRSFSADDSNAVVIDNKGASYDAVSLLIKNGYKRIGMIAYKSALTHMQNRIAGYKKALSDNKIPLNEKYIYRVTHENLPEDVPHILNGLLMGRKRQVDALLFATNAISVAALKYLNSLRIKVPEELGVVCFDENEAYDFFYSPVTYVKQDMNGIGQNAIRVLMDIIEGKEVRSPTLTIPAAVIQRASSG